MTRRPTRRTWLAAAVLLGCTPQPPAPPSVPAASRAMIDGRWDYQAPPPGPNLLELELWRIGTSDSLGGRLVAMMNGNMGSRPDQFGPIAGAVADTAIWFAIPQAGTEALRFEGRLVGDTILVTRSTIGADEGPYPAGGRFVRKGPRTQ